MTLAELIALPKEDFIAELLRTIGTPEADALIAEAEAVNDPNWPADGVRSLYAILWGKLAKAQHPGLQAFAVAVGLRMQGNPRAKG